MNAIELSKNIIAYAANEWIPSNKPETSKDTVLCTGILFGAIWKATFADEIVNWAYGPVVPEAYFKFCSYGAAPIEAEDIPNYFAGLGYGESGYICKVVNACLCRTARRLVEKLIRKTRG